MAVKAPAAKAKAAAAARPEPTHDEIAKRSYEIYLARGGADGHHEEDWARAEAELRRDS